MEVKIGKVHLPQIENRFESSNNKIALEGLVKFLKEMYDHYNHRLDTRRAYSSRLICKDVKVVRNVQGGRKARTEVRSVVLNSAITKSQITSLFLHHTTIL